MTDWVVDASVGIKWFVPEPGAADDKLVNALAGTPWSSFVIRLAGVP